MPKTPEVIPITNLRQEAAAVLKRVRASRQAVVITRRGRAAVMLSVEAYERAERERQILRLLARGKREITDGEGYDLNEVLAEADHLLSDA